MVRPYLTTKQTRMKLVNYDAQIINTFQFNMVETVIVEIRSVDMESCRRADVDKNDALVRDQNGVVERGQIWCIRSINHPPYQ